MCARNYNNMETFDEYFEQVVGNIHPNIIPDKLFFYAENRIREICYKLFRLDIDYKKAAVIIETVFNQLNGMIILPRSEDYEYLNDDFYTE